MIFEIAIVAYITCCLITTATICVMPTNDDNP